MITKIKILKCADMAQMTATAVTDCQFVDAWLNLDHVLVVMPDPSMNLLRVRFNGAQSIAVTYAEWERVAKLYGFHEWTEEEVAQHEEDSDCIGQLMDRADDLKGYQFTAIIEDDGRTLESFPRGLAGQEVRVTVLGNPWETK